MDFLRDGHLDPVPLGQLHHDVLPWEGWVFALHARLDDTLSSVITDGVTIIDPSGTRHGRWELADGTLYDVTHLPCRTGVYTGASCKPTDAMQPAFPVKPGAKMPTFDGCQTEDWAVLFVIGVEA